MFFNLCPVNEVQRGGVWCTWHLGLSPWKDVSHTLIIPNFDLKVKFIGCFTWLCARAKVSIVLWHSYTISGTWVYHLRMHEVSPLYDLDLLPQYKNYIFTMNLCLGKIVFALCKSIPNLTLWCITMRQHIMYILGVMHNLLTRIHDSYR